MKKYIILILLVACRIDADILRPSIELHGTNSKTWKQEIYYKTENDIIKPLQLIQDRWVFYANNTFETMIINNKGIWILDNEGYWIIEGEKLKIMTKYKNYIFKILSLTTEELILESNVRYVIYNETWIPL